MRRPTVTLLFPLLLLSVIMGNAIAASKNVVSAAQIDGTWVAGWESKDGKPSTHKEIKILALGKQRLKIEFFGEYGHIDQSGEPAMNIGVATGNASIQKNVAQFKPSNTAEDWECVITMTLEKDLLVVAQQNECGFGLHVYADGIYRRESTDKPTFNESFWSER